MADYKNTSGADFAMPDGRTVAHGATIDLDAKALSIPGVAQFVEAGKLVATEPEKPKRGRPAKVADEGESE